MEGYLAKKTTGGKWKNRYFKLENSELSWLKSDNKTALTLNLTKGDVDVRDIKFSARKYVFEVDAEGRTLCLAAAGDAEKEQWIIAIKKQAGLYKEKRITIVKEGGPKKLDQNKVAGIANVLGLQSGGTGGAGPAFGGMKSAQANEKLKEKLVGTSLPMLGAPTVCKECGKTVYKVEELVINGMIFHKTCFRCTKCHRELTKTNHAYVPKEDSFYCKVHYAELFGGDALVAAVTIGKSDNPAKEIDGLDEKQKEQEEKEEALRREEELRVQRERQKQAPKETFAKDAIAIREKKYGKAEDTEVYVESLPTKEAAEPGIIDNSATLGRPTIMARRQQPRRKSVGKILPPEEIKDRKMHDLTFQLQDGTGTTIVLHTSSIFERNKWVTCIANAVFAVKLKHDLQQA
ncbi:MAG: LIM domain-containing protein, partial [Fervidobacterium pennivorans]